MNQMLWMNGMLVSETKTDAEDIYDDIIQTVSDKDAAFYGGAYPMDDHNAYIDKHGEAPEEAIIASYIKNVINETELVVALQKMFEDYSFFLSGKSDGEPWPAAEAAVPSMLYEAAGTTISEWHRT